MTAKEAVDQHPGSGKIMKKRNLRPKFKTEAEERKFWETHDSTD